MNRFWNHIGSRRFAIHLFLVTTVVLLLSNALPNFAVMNVADVQRLREERPLVYGLAARFGIRQLSKSWYFQALPAFIFISITVCTIKRIRAELERSEAGDKKPDISSVHKMRYNVGPVKDVGREEIERVLKGKRWKVYSIAAKEEIVYARKGEGGIWGSFAFHAGMNIVLTGVLFSVFTAFDGMLTLTEGFPVDTPKEIMRDSKGDVPDFPLAQMMLETFVPRYSGGGFPLQYTCSVIGVGRDGKAVKHLIDVNEPARIGGYKFIFTKGGYAPRFVVKSDKGEVLNDSVVNLSITIPGVTDMFEVPDEGITVKAELFPDYYEENGLHKNKGEAPNNPALFVEIMKDGKMIGRGFLHKGKAVAIGKYSIEFSELRHWVSLVVSKDFGLTIIIIGFAFISVGLFIRFFLNGRSLWIIINRAEGGTMLGLGGRARFFPALFDDELRSLGEELGGRKPEACL